jgi:hypothetical protein
MATYAGSGSTGNLYVGGPSPDIPLTRDQLRAKGMTEKEIDIQLALGSTPMGPPVDDINPGYFYFHKDKKE